MRTIDAFSFAYTSAAGCSTNTLQPSMSIGAIDASTCAPARSVENIARLARILALGRGLHVRQMGEVRLAQHQADVGVGDEEALAVDDVGLALVADLDPRDDVPDELEVDVGNRHRSAVAAGADRNRHVRLGFLAEVHRPEPGLAALRIAKRRLLRAILARPGDVHPEPRHRDLLATGGVDLRDVGHFRRLAQELQEFETPQLHVAGIELRQRGIGELLIDLPDVLLDPRCRGDRLFVLQLGERGSILLV